MKKIALTYSGWIAAVAFAALAVLRTPDADEEDTAPDEADDAAPLSGESAWIPDEEPAPAEEDADAAAAGNVQPGDEWSPSSVRSPEGILALLCGLGKADRETGMRIIAARRSSDWAALLSAAEDALRSAEPGIRAMAVRALKEMDGKDSGWLDCIEEARQMTILHPEPYEGRNTQLSPGEEARRADLLLEFCRDENGYVKSMAHDSFLHAFSNMGDFNTCLELSEKLIAAVQSAEGGVAGCLGAGEIGSAIVNALGANILELDPERFESGVRALSEFVCREGGDPLGLEGIFASAWKFMDGVGVPRGVLKDEAALEQFVGGRKAALADAKARFQDDALARCEFIAGTQRLKDTAAERYGDSERAQTWVAEMQTLLQEELMNRDKTLSPAELGMQVEEFMP